tara:strand:- start:1508 stop:2560 length:1053 start_codon:yes stop_codon:yes gene_type:complete
MKKLLFITPIFPKNINDDTIVPFIFQFCDFFNKKYPDIEIEIISLKYPFTNKPYIINNINVHPIAGGFKNKIHNSFTILKAIIKGITLFRKNKYDGILSFWYSDTALIATILNKIFKTKHYTWMQGQDIKSENFYIKTFKPKTTNLIVVGKNHNELLFKYQNIKAATIANVAVVPYNFPKINTSTRKIDILGVGNLSKLKNFNLFIEIIHKLKETNEKINVMICGDGEEMQILSDKIKYLDLENNITLTGYISNKKVRLLMNNCKLLLHTSNFEGNSLVIQEALYSGCKVISRIPLKENIKNFYYEEEKDKIIKLVNDIFSEKKIKHERIRYFKIEDTSEIIYSCFFNDK